MSLGNEGGIDHFPVELEGPGVVLRFRDDSAGPVDLFSIGLVGAPNHVDLFGVDAGAGGETGPGGVESLGVEAVGVVEVGVHSVDGEFAGGRRMNVHERAGRSHGVPVAAGAGFIGQVPGVGAAEPHSEVFGASKRGHNLGMFGNLMNVDDGLGGFDHGDDIEPVQARG